MGSSPLRDGSATAKAVRIAAYLIITYLLLTLLGPVVHVLLLVFAGLLVATFLDATTAWLAKRLKLPRKLALALVCVLLAGATVSFWIAVLPSLSRQVEELGKALPLAVDRLATTLGREGWGSDLVSQIKKADEMVSSQAALRSATTAAGLILGGLGSVALVLFIGLFVAVEPGQYRRGFLRLVPVARRERFGDVIDHTVTSLQRWLLATTFAMIVVGVLSFIGLSVLGVPLAFSLAVLAALMTFIPNVGPVIAAVPAVLLGLLASGTTALLVAGLYLVVQILETYLITPLIQRKLLSLPPALILIAQAIMAVFGGLVGVIVATPLTLVAIVVIQKLYVEDRLERSGAVIEP
ncbi:MAG: AI-2E family transporter [Deltaproteobacteria bacterium]|nr:AI-2E family transporter [Deltaproteobacteria bacterium]